MQNAGAVQMECVHNACRRHTGCMHAKRRRNADAMHTACVHECAQVAPWAYEAKSIPIAQPGYSDSCAFCYWSVWARAECIWKVHGMYAESIQNAHIIDVNWTQMHTQCMRNAYKMHTECMQNACTMRTEWVYNACRMHTGCMYAKRRQNADVMHTTHINECVQVAPRTYEAKSMPSVHPGCSDPKYAFCHWSVWVHRMLVECLQNAWKTYATC